MSWPSGCVADIAEVISGYAFKSAWFGSGSSKIIRIGDLQGGRIKSDSGATFDSSIHKIGEQFKIMSGDILMAMSGATVGKIAIARECDAGSYLNQRVVIIRGRCQENADYLKYVFSGDLLTKLLLSAGGAAQPNLSPKDLSAMRIPLPPLAEQKRIAAILDKADAIRRKRQQAIQLADDFLRSVFLDMFGDPVSNPKGWEVMQLTEVCSVQGGLQVSKKRNVNPLVKPYLRVANVMRNELKLDEIKTMNVTSAEFERIKLKKNDILVVEGHGNKEEIGRCSIWDGSILDAIHQNHLIRVRVNSNDVTTQFVNDYINSKGGRIQMLGSSNTTSGLNTISTRIVKETEIPIPPKMLQEKYCDIVEKVNSFKSLSANSRANCERNFESISQKFFSGQL